MSAKKSDYEMLFWDAFRNGDEKAFTSVYNLFYKSLYNYGRKICHDVPLIEDSIHDLFVGLWRSRKNLSKVTSIRFYLFKSLRNKLFQNTDRSFHFTDVESFAWDKADLISASAEMNIVNAEEVDERAKKLKHLLYNLPPRQYEALMLRFYEGFSFEEIADIMKVNPQTARNFTQRGIERLRQYSKIIISITGLLAFIPSIPIF